MTKSCSVCGKDNRHTARFCAGCATPMPQAPPVQGPVSSGAGQVCGGCGTHNLSASRFCLRCGMGLQTQVQAPRTGPGTGMLSAQSLLAGRYLVVQRVGQGGMGAVYKATDMRLGPKVVAVKEMSDSSITDPFEKLQAQQAFEQEAKMLAMLNHPQLPRVSDHFTHGGKKYLVMDFIEGSTLEELLEQAQGPLDVNKVVAWGVQLCEVLEYLHSQNPPIIFRDLKPANIMVNQSGQIKLIDFGIARVFKSGKKSDTTALGTEGYAPPEQYGKQQTDARSDLYALAATLHHVLTFRDPAQSPFKFAPIRSLNHNVPIAIEQAIMRALEQRPDQRWQNARQMRDALMAPVAVPVPKPVPKPIAVPKPVAVPKPKPVPKPVPIPKPVILPPQPMPSSGGMLSQLRTSLTDIMPSSFSMPRVNGQRIIRMAILGGIMGAIVGQSGAVAFGWALAGAFFGLIGWGGFFGGLFGAFMAEELGLGSPFGFFVGMIMGVILGKRGWAIIIGIGMGAMIGAVFAEEAGMLIGAILGGLLGFYKNS